MKRVLGVRRESRKRGFFAFCLESSPSQVTAEALALVYLAAYLKLSWFRE